MVVKFGASAAVTAFLLSASVGSTQAAAQAIAQQAVPAASDSAFLQMVSSLALLQAKLGKLAEDKGSSPAVREFGKRMVSDYSKVNEELAAAAKQAAYPAPVMLRQHRQLYDRFRGTGGSSFDKKYMAEAVSDHGLAVSLYRQESESGRVASLKQLASSTLPTAEEHLTLATETARSVGADVTATASRDKQGS
jgi:putative membrane protein